MCPPWVAKLFWLASRGKRKFSLIVEAGWTVAGVVEENVVAGDPLMSPKPDGAENAGGGLGVGAEEAPVR